MPQKIRLQIVSRQSEAFLFLTNLLSTIHYFRVQNYEYFHKNTYFSEKIIT